MSWTSKSKGIDIKTTKDHPAKTSGLVSRAPGIKTVSSFTPAEFFGAAGRCCHLHVINPALVTPESTMIKALVEQHVDDTKSKFAVESSADNFKDYVSSYFSGTVASGIAYLAMIRDGYAWSDHFENIGGGNPHATKSPDFVFTRPGAGDAALVESKGTRSTSSSFNSTVRDGYDDQVEPHLGHTVGTSTASHGYCIGSDLSSTTEAELNVHYTGAVPATGPTGPATGPGTSTAVQRHNYATAFRLSHSESLSRQVRQGRIEDHDIEFFAFDWLGRRWLTGQVAALPPIIPPPYPPATAYVWLASLATWAWHLPIFALESSIALQILGTLSRYPERLDAGFEIRPIEADLIRMAGAESGGGAAIFPDGLASFINRDFTKSLRRLLWNRDAANIVKGDW